MDVRTICIQKRIHTLVDGPDTIMIEKILSLIKEIYFEVMSKEHIDIISIVGLYSGEINKYDFVSVDPFCCIAPTELE